MLVLNSNWNYILDSFGQGLTEGFNRGLITKLEQDLYKQKLQQQLEKQKELIKYKQDLEKQAKKELLKELLGREQPEVTNLDSIFRVGDIQESINNALPQPAINRAVNNAFGIQQKQNKGFLGNYWENLKQNFAMQSPLPETPKVELKYKGGALSDLANQNPLIGDYIKAQVYGIKLPEIKKKEKKYEAKVVNRVLYTFDPITGEWIKKGEVKKVIKETPQRMLVDTGAEKLLVDKKDGKVIKRYKVHKTEKSKNIDLRLKTLDKAINKILKKYKLDKGMLFATQPQARSVIEEIRKVNPKDAERLQRWYEEYIRLTEETVGIKPEQKEPEKTTRNNPFSIFEE